MTVLGGSSVSFSVQAMIRNPIPGNNLTADAGYESLIP